MTFDGLIPATLVRRYKRFLADVTLADGQLLTVHCPNTGAMTGCAEAGWQVWLSHSDARHRKYPHTWELVETAQGVACIHSARANRVVEEAVQADLIPGLHGYPECRREVKYGDGCRADLRLDGADGPACTIEVKSVTLCEGDGVGRFPDAVSSRARKHLEALTALAMAGERAVIFFCVFHEGIHEVRPAVAIDPAYCEALATAAAAGVETMAWKASITPGQIRLAQSVPVVLAP